jgi:hypothetical protein
MRLANRHLGLRISSSDTADLDGKHHIPGSNW